MKGRLDPTSFDEEQNCYSEKEEYFNQSKKGIHAGHCECNVSAQKNQQ